MRNPVEIISTFLRETIWFERRETRRAWRFLTRLLQVSFLVGKGFLDDNCFLRASALAYTTLLSLVPLLAFTFAIVKGLGGEELVRPYLEAEAAKSRADSGEANQGEAQVATGGSDTSDTSGGVSPMLGYVFDRLTANQKEVANRIAGYIARTNVKALGVLGLVVLLYTVVKVLGTVEASFNEIWGVRQGRTWMRKVADYTSVVVVAPVLLVTAIGVSTYLRVHPFGGPDVVVTFWRVMGQVAAKVGPYVLTWVAFMAFYAFMPNTQVSFSSVLAGGLVGGTLWQVAFWGYTSFQVVVARYNAIYTSFAALPVFLVWLYLSWVIALFGAEVAFAIGHLATYRRTRESFAPSPEARERLALRLFFEIASVFHAGRAPLGVDALSTSTGLPLRGVREAVAGLVASGFLSEVQAKVGPAYQPARDLSQLTPADILAAVRRAGDAVETPDDDPLWQETLRAAGIVSAALSHDQLKTSFEAILEARK